MWVPRDSECLRKEGGHSTLGRSRDCAYAQYAEEIRSADEMPRPRARRRATQARKVKPRTGRPVCDSVHPAGVDTSPKGDIPPDTGFRSADIVAYLRTLQKSPPRDGSDQRSGRSSERPLRVFPVVCAYDHATGGSKHKRLTGQIPTRSFVPTTTPQVVPSTND